MADYLDYLMGIGETGATLGSGAMAGLLGMPYGVYKGATSGKLGTREANRIAEEEARRFMEQYTYQPRGNVAPEMMQTLGGLLESSKLPPVMPEAAMLASIPRQAVAAQAERAGMAAERAVAPMVERTMKKGGLGAGLLGDLSQGSRSPLDVYHGTPHTLPPTPRNPLGEFDASKIGTGEGGQAYGYGIYTAEAPDVAKEYQKQLGTQMQYKGKQFYDPIVGRKTGTTGNTEIDDYLLSYLGDTGVIRKELLNAAKEEFKVVTGLEAEAFGLPGSSKWQVNTTSKQATLVPAAPGAFGGGVQGNAYDIILDGVNSGKTNTVQYALAFRALSMPVPTEQVQADGSLKTVYTQPMPLPASIPKPTFSGKIPEVTKPVTVVPSAAQAAPTPAPVTARAPTPSAAPVVSPTEGATAVPLPAGVKSTPMAARPEEISKSRESINAGVDFVAALNKMENMVREQGMQLGGMGQKGASQSAIYEDLLTKARLAAQLGVLNKEDLPRLQAQLSDPTALSTYIRGLGGPAAFYAQIGELRSRIVDETTRKNLQFGQPIMNLPSTFSVTAPAPIPRTTTVAPPPAIQNLLNKYKP